MQNQTKRYGQRRTGLILSKGTHTQKKGKIICQKELREAETIHSWFQCGAVGFVLCSINFTDWDISKTLGGRVNHPRDFSVHCPVRWTQWSDVFQTFSLPTGHRTVQEHNQGRMVLNGLLYLFILSPWVWVKVRKLTRVTASCIHA